MKLDNLNCDEAQKLKLWWISKTQIVIILKNSNCEEIQNTKWQNSKTQIVTKLKTQTVTKNQIVT